jgi:hypothetical protein
MGHRLLMSSIRKLDLKLILTFTKAKLTETGFIWKKSKMNKLKSKGNYKNTEQGIQGK